MRGVGIWATEPGFKKKVALGMGLEDGRGYKGGRPCG